MSRVCEGSHDLLPPPPSLRALALFWYFVALIAAAESIPSMMDAAVGTFVTAAVTFIAHAVYFTVPDSVDTCEKRRGGTREGLGRAGKGLAQPDSSSSCSCPCSCSWL
jgi:hypothetical protein